MSLITLITQACCPCLFSPQRPTEPDESASLLPYRREQADRVTLRHKKPPGLASSPNSARQIITDVISKAKYAKRPEVLLAPERGFRAEAEDEISPSGDYLFKKITLKNFNEPLKTGSTYEGVCQDLAFSVGKALQGSKLGEDYEIEVATGFCPQYFQGGTHFFILATPKKPESAPHESILIDPSFGKIIENYRDIGANPKKYSISKRWKLDEFYKFRGELDNSFKLLKPMYDPEELPPSGSCIPMGYVRDIIPELVKGEDPYGAMLYLSFQISPEDRETILVRPSIQRNSHAVPQPMPDALLKGLPEDHPFLRLLTKIKTDLNPPKRLHRSHKMLNFNLYTSNPLSSG